MNKNEIQYRCREILGKQIKDILPRNHLATLIKENKGSIGDAIELCFGLRKNNSPKPDFIDAGIELKVTPLKISKKKTTDSFICYIPKERVKLTCINYFDIVNETTFENSKLFKKCKKILFIFYIYSNDKKFYEYNVFNFCFYNIKDDVNYNQIKNDYFKIKKKIEKGQAHLLSESDTELLGACINAKNSKCLTNQPNSNEKAKPRAFSFKLKQVNNILNNINNKEINQLYNDLNNKLDKYKGKSIETLSKNFKLNYNLKNTKNIKSKIINNILNTKNYLEYIKKFNLNKIMIKNITLLENNKLKEEIGLINVDFIEFKNKIDFYDSEFFSFLDELTIIFIIWKRIDKNEVFDSIKLFKINNQMIKNAKIVWEHTRDLFINSKCIKYEQKNKILYNFVKKSDNLSFHVRPHDSKRIPRTQMNNGKFLCKFQYWLNKDSIKF